MWLMQGYWQYTLKGLEPPKAIQQETAQYFAAQDLFQLFLEDNYVPDENGKVYAKVKPISGGAAIWEKNG